MNLWTSKREHYNCKIHYLENITIEPDIDESGKLSDGIGTNGVWGKFESNNKVKFEIRSGGLGGGSHEFVDGLKK